MKLWDKGYTIDKLVEKFTVGNDRDMDLYLAPYDILGSIAHVIMLESIGLITKDEFNQLKKELVTLFHYTEKEQLIIDDGVEDIHSQVEIILTQKLGDTGKKIHSGRSRNDQVLLDIKLFLRNEIKTLVQATKKLFDKLIQLSNQYKDNLLPGYTHFQVAMPSSFGLWFGAYAEALADDMQILLAAYKIINQNPLGSGAGYGSSFPLNRKLTTELLGFEDLNYNVVYAQMGRGKAEKTMAFALAAIGSTIAKLSMDICIYMGQNHGFISFPDEYTTGSSIMPHKKNPDIFELVRANGNKIQSLPNEISLITTNLPSGYHRDMQLLKENLFPSFEQMNLCLAILEDALGKITINKKILEDEKYLYLFSVEEVNNLVIKGVPFRDAYKQIAEKINKNTFSPQKEIHHSHEGSIGNLCNTEIEEKMNTVIKAFDFKKQEMAIMNLLGK